VIPDPDSLLFQMDGGTSLPFSPQMISVELLGGAAELFDEEFVRHASEAVFHFFKHELKRESVSVGEFAEALEKVLRGFALKVRASAKEKAGLPPRVIESDLRTLACETGKGCELFFFPRLREELRRHLKEQPRLVRFRGLRGCAKQLLGVQRRGPRCRDLEDQIVTFLRQCAASDAGSSELALVVE
jgi:hypothetical protein